MKTLKKVVSCTKFKKNDVMSVITDLAPKALWGHFDEICKRPHPSKSESLIIEYIEQFAADNGIECYKDSIGNIILRKAATAGYENRKGIILQAHIDMVPQANSDKVFDFEKDPIVTIVEGDWLRADGTTLGADNGIGVAAALAVFGANDLEHGPIEALFTVDEEAGMSGAFALEEGVLQGDILMNLDSETEGELYVGCAGGVIVNASIPYTIAALEGDYKGVEIGIKGLKGGHSGLEIILQRGNACKIAARLLNSALSKFQFKMSAMSVGNMFNAIPREGTITLAVSPNDFDSFVAFVAEYEAVIKNELALTDENISISVTECERPVDVVSDISLYTFASAAHATPNGVIRMSDSMPGLVETSLNMGIISLEGGAFNMTMLIRSSVDSAKDDMVASLCSLYSIAGVSYEVTGDYSGWNPNMDSPILKSMQQAYNNKYGRQPEVMAIHAGLECGIIGGKYPNLDMISFGPTICFPHSPDEKVQISSVEKFWDFMVASLENAPVK